MNTHSGIRVFRPWIKVRIAKPPSSRLHSKPPEDPPAPVQDEADEGSAGQARTGFHRYTSDRRASLSRNMKHQWTQPEYRKKRLAGLQEYWSAPGHRALQSDFMKDIWAQPDLREKRSAAAREAWSRLSPEDRERRNAINRENWSPETRKKASASAIENWNNRPEDKEVLAARMSALWKIPEKKDALIKGKVFRRDDDDPTMKMRWEGMKKEAKIFADSLNARKLRVQYHNAFIHLHLDVSQYDSELDQTVLTRCSQVRYFTDAQFAKLKEKFLENVILTGLPEMSSKVFNELAKELRCETRMNYLRQQLNKERKVWLHAAAVLRRKGVDVDYANIPHLAWLEEVGRL